MNRREFIYATGALAAIPSLASAAPAGTQLSRLVRPLAITMWDFSWLERRWPGAGYENWDEALDQLVARGYDAIRIDAFPHLVAADPNKTWELIPVWSVQDWGSPAKNRVQVQPALNQFIRKCADRKLTSRSLPRQMAQENARSANRRDRKERQENRNERCPGALRTPYVL